MDRLVKRAYALEMVFMVARGKNDKMWQNEVASQLKKYDGKFENWAKSNREELEALVNKFDAITLKPGTAAYNNKRIEIADGNL